MPHPSQSKGVVSVSKPYLLAQNLQNSAISQKQVEQSIQAILSTIDEAISSFQNAIPNIQKLVYDELQPLVKQLQIKNGKLLNNLDNLKLIGQLQNKLEKIIISAEYKSSVQKFIDSFSAVSSLNNDYFSQFNKKYKPKKTLPIIKQLAVESTINDLVGQGLSSNVIAPIQKILQQNITTGGSYADFQNVLQNHILSNETGEGSLQRYTKQITTDAINQYNAQYGETIAQDLQFNWGRYIGSNLTTTRQFCELLTAKQWVHKSELGIIIKGNIDGEQCKLSKTTGLPIGLVADTNASNFKVRRGGYNCGHQFFWVQDSSVPAGVLKKFESKDLVIKTTIEDKPIINLDKKGKVLFLDVSAGLVPALGELINRGRKVITDIEKKKLISINGLELIIKDKKAILYSTNTQNILPHELSTIKKLLGLGHDVLFMPDAYFKRNSKKFDVLVFDKNKYFRADLKEIKSTNPDTIEKAISYGGTQAGNIIIDIKSDIDTNTLASSITAATKSNNDINSIIIFYKGSKKTYFRNGVLSKKFVRNFYNDFHK